MTQVQVENMELCKQYCETRRRFLEGTLERLMRYYVIYDGNFEKLEKSYIFESFVGDYNSYIGWKKEIEKYSM